MIATKNSSLIVNFCFLLNALTEAWSPNKEQMFTIMLQKKKSGFKGHAKFFPELITFSRKQIISFYCTLQLISLLSLFVLTLK